MRRDPTEFRKRFAAWKNGKKPYHAGKISDQQYYETMERVAELNNAEWNRLRREEGGRELSSGRMLPRYKKGKDGYKYSWDDETKSWNRYTGDEMGQAFNDFVAVPQGSRQKFNYEKAPTPLHTPKVETDKEYTQRRIAETTKTDTPIADAINLGVGFIPGVSDAKDAIASSVALAKGDYKEAALLGAGLMIPNAIEKPIKAIKALNKARRRLLHEPSPFASHNYSMHAMYDAARRVATRAATVTRHRTQEEKKAFQEAYASRVKKNYQSPFEDNPVLSQKEQKRFNDLLERNPEFEQFLVENYTTPNGIKYSSEDVFSGKAVRDFLDRQFTSLRGVHSNKKEDAIKYLTETEPGRPMPGGDRLRTNGGLYTSNSTNVADRFKNPVGKGTEDGYVAKLFYPHGIPENIPVEDQLEAYRRLVFPAGPVHPAYKKDFYYKELDRAKKNGAVALESDYAGTAAAGIPGQERAYLPIGSGPRKAVDIIDLQYYPKQKDQAGRWMAGMNAGDASGLFIPRQMNAYSDYIRSARAFLDPVVVDEQLYSAALGKANQNFRKQTLRRAALANKLAKRQADARTYGREAGVILGSAAIAGGLYANTLYAIHRREKRRQLKSKETSIKEQRDVN